MGKVFLALLTDCFSTLCWVWHISHLWLFGAGASVSGALVEASNRQALVPSLHFSSVEISGCSPLIHSLIFVLLDLLEKECETRTDDLVACSKKVCLPLWRFVSLGTKVCPPAAPPHVCSSSLSCILCADVCRSRVSSFVASVGDNGNFWLL